MLRNLNATYFYIYILDGRAVGFPRPVSESDVESHILQFSDCLIASGISVEQLLEDLRSDRSLVLESALYVRDPRIHRIVECVLRYLQSVQVPVDLCEPHEDARVSDALPQCLIPPQDDPRVVVHQSPVDQSLVGVHQVPVLSLGSLRDPLAPLDVYGLCHVHECIR